MQSIARWLVRRRDGAWRDGAPAAQEFPSRTVKIVMGFGPGGLGDIAGRAIGAGDVEVDGSAIAFDITSPMARPAMSPRPPGPNPMTIFTVRDGNSCAGAGAITPAPISEAAKPTSDPSCIALTA